MNTNDYDRANNKAKGYDCRLERQLNGYYVMVTLDDPSVGIYKQTISPEFMSPSDFEEWLEYIEGMFGK